MRDYGNLKLFSVSLNNNCERRPCPRRWRSGGKPTTAIAVVAPRIRSLVLAKIERYAGHYYEKRVSSSVMSHVVVCFLSIQLYLYMQIYLSWYNSDIPMYLLINYENWQKLCGSIKLCNAVILFTLEQLAAIGIFIRTFWH